MKILACVVAYNRAPLLRASLQALTQQTADVDVLVIDNASTDDTADVVAEFPSVRYFSTGSNLGGAGGFAWAIELACALGYDQAYLLDDDAVPDRDAIEILLDARSTSVDLAAMPFLASCPVSADEDRLPAGTPAPSGDFARHVRSAASGAIAIDHASFLGVLIDLAAARRTALPYSEFFIWCDDIEYTTRIGGAVGGACVPASRIVHESVAMESAVSKKPLGWKFRYRVRNTLWLARWGLPDASSAYRVALAFAPVRATINELRGAPAKVEAIRIGASAWTSGLFGAKPVPVPVGGLLAASPDARIWVAAHVTMDA